MVTDPLLGAFVLEEMQLRVPSEVVSRLFERERNWLTLTPCCKIQIYMGKLMCGQFCGNYGYNYSYSKRHIHKCACGIIT